MTYPRSHTVSEQQNACFHVFSRCVRRAWLFSNSSFDGRELNNRATLLEKRLIELSNCFSISLFSYAVMNNHYHAVVKVEPERAREWSDQDVANRWLRCSGSQIGLVSDSPELLGRINSFIENEERVKVARNRLSSLSWFVRKINEPIARIANAEDDCTGRFWEGRFKSQVLLDDSAVLSCMAYVDLNPVRAGIVTKVENSSFTSINRRLNTSELSSSLGSINGTARSLPYPEMTLESYLADLKRIVDQGKDSSSMLTTGIQPPDKWRRAIGSKQNMQAFADRLGQRWLQRPDADQQG